MSKQVWDKEIMIECYFNKYKQEMNLQRKLGIFLRWDKMNGLSIIQLLETEIIIHQEYAKIEKPIKPILLKELKVLNQN